MTHIEPYRIWSSNSSSSSSSPSPAPFQLLPVLVASFSDDDYISSGMLSAPEAAAETSASRPPSRGGDGAPAEGAVTAGGGDAPPPAPPPGQPDHQPQQTAQQAPNQHRDTDDEEAQSGGADTPVIGRPRAAPERGFWGSRPPSPGGSESSAVMPPPPSRPKSRAGGKYDSLNYWRAKRVIFYKNGDPYYQGLEFRFRPGRDVTSLEGLLDKLSQRLDLPRGARFVFSMDGDRKESLDDLVDGHSYVVSSYKTFKNATYGKKNGGAWYPPDATPRGWSKPPVPSRKPSMPDPDHTNKPSSGRVIRIINNHDHTVQCRVLLNLRTTQPFEDVVEDLGQVLKMNGARRMFTVSGQEVRSFSQLRNEFSDVDTFYLGTTGVLMSPDRRRSRSRGPVLVEPVTTPAVRRRARSKSRPRALYIEPEVMRPANGPYQQVSPYQDYTLLEVLKEEPIRLTIKGARRTVYPPLHHAPQDNSPPEKRLVLDWVYGYRGTDSRRNLWVLPTGELLYYVAAIAVLYDRDEEAQRHYIGHTEDIQCMDVHPSRELVASGQRAGRNRKTQAHIRIWSTETLLTLYVFGMGEFEIGVSAVAFSQLNGGSYVLAVDGGRERILSVWQWQWGHLLGKVATLQEDLTGAAFHPLDDNLLITHGKGHLTFWTRRKDGYFEKTDIIKPPSRTHITCLQFEQDGDVVTADGDGFITIYSVDSEGAYFVRMEFEAHNKGISSLVMLSEGTLLSGGEKDRKIIAWDSLQNYKKITEAKLSENAGGVRSIYPQRPGRNDGNIYVGTTKNNILEGSMQRRFNQVVFGHGRQLWGLAVHPDDELFATAGHDKHIALWKKHKLLWTVLSPHECVSLSFHPFGAALAAGSTDGHLLVLNAEAGNTVATVRVCGSSLSCLSYNPAGDMLAIGSQNGSVYLFRVSRDGYNYKKINKIRGAQPLSQLDWSTDGNYIQTVTAEYDLVFWDVKALTNEKSPITMKDVKWYTQNCSVGFLVAGIWNNRYYPQTSVVSTVSRSAAHDLLVVGDTEGYLRLFRYPCISQKAEYNEEKVYSMSIAAARFLYNDRNVATVGGSDASLMLWQVVDE